ncbi:hypothetical protein BDZ91DRAFT_735305 [Kalaharituber pfeilii]|nr:hypothetical protein BDZ91DRAFT_735305 [Kalaharituber pfeilii]
MAADWKRRSYVEEDDAPNWSGPRGRTKMGRMSPGNRRHPRAPDHVRRYTGVAGDGGHWVLKVCM